jgi:hypothetical protein
MSSSCSIHALPVIGQRQLRSEGDRFRPHRNVER